LGDFAARAYYLVHSIGDSGRLEERSHQSWQRFDSR
jgi:hypothetical protein